MSGPALRQVLSHAVIHEAAWRDADDAWRLAQEVRARSHDEVFLRVVEVFLEVVETRILTHAAEEETGLYQEWRELDKGWQPFIVELVGEHDTLRRLAAAIEEAMTLEHYDGATIQMGRLLQVSADHARHEEDVLRRVYSVDKVRE